MDRFLHSMNAIFAFHFLLIQKSEVYKNHLQYDVFSRMLIFALYAFSALR